MSRQRRVVSWEDEETILDPRRRLTADTEQLQLPVEEDDDGPSPTVQMLAWMAVALLGVLVAGGGIAIAQHHLSLHSASIPDGTVNEDVRVPTAVVAKAPASRNGRFFGITRASTRASLSFPVGGRLLERNAEVGARVRAGTLLARIDVTTQRAQASAASASGAEVDAQIWVAEREQTRMESLLAAGAVSQQDRDRAFARTQSLRASRRVAGARAWGSGHAASDGRLVAPFDGIVTAVRVQVGEVVGPGAPVIMMSGDDGAEIELSLPETAVSPDLREGVEVAVSFPVLGRREPIRGRVTHLSSAATSGFFPLVIALDEGVPAGLTAEVVLPVPTRAQLSVPVEAIVDPAGRQPRVIVVRGGKAVFVDVEAFDLVDGWVSIGGPVVENEQVVIGRHPFLLPGDNVRPFNGSGTGGLRGGEG